VTFEVRFAIARAPVRMPLNWTDRVDSMPNEPLCPVTRAPDKSNNFTERSKGAYRPRERSKVREKEEGEVARQGKGTLESEIELLFPIPLASVPLSSPSE